MNVSIFKKLETWHKQVFIITIIIIVIIALTISYMLFHRTNSPISKLADKNSSNSQSSVPPSPTVDKDKNLKEAVTLLKTNEYLKAFNKLRMLSKIYVGDQKIIELLAYSAYSAGLYAEACKYYKILAELLPDSTEPYIGLAYSYEKRGLFEKAIKIYEKVIQMTKPTSELYTNIANLYMKLHNYNKAIKTYKKALELNRRYFDALYNLGIAYFVQGNNKSALLLLFKALNVNKGYLACYLNIGRVLIDMAQYKRAITVLTALKKLLPQNHMYLPETKKLIKKAKLLSQLQNRAKSKKTIDHNSLILKSLPLKKVFQYQDK